MKEDHQSALPNAASHWQLVPQWDASGKEDNIDADLALLLWQDQHNIKYQARDH
jgi:hypothetical protein